MTDPTADPHAGRTVLSRPLPARDGIFVERAGAAYSDIGAFEEEQLLAQLPSGDWRALLARTYARTRPWLYDIITNPRRAAALSILDVAPDHECLDVGSGWGQLAVPLARMAHVHALDQTLNRARILGEIARQEGVALQRYVGDFLTLPFADAAFDLVLMNGSLEYMGVGRSAPAWECQLAALQRAQALLRAGGLLYLGIENALGLKYLFGTPDDHTGTPRGTLAGLRGRDCREPIAVWSLSQYHELFARAGLAVESAYAAFPDYKLPHFLVPLEQVDGFIERAWHALVEHSGVDGQPLPFQADLALTYRGLAREGIARHFPPSFAFRLRKPD